MSDPRTALGFTMDEPVAESGQIEMATGPQAGVRLAFDVSDLLAYFPHNRAPTGIQRVQMEIILQLLAGPSGEDISLVRFLPARSAWVEVPPEGFRALSSASKAGGDPQERGWRELYAEVDAATTAAPELVFARGALLVNLGTSWWLKNYFLQIRELQAKYAVEYIPLIYDVIPAIKPEYCSEELVGDFVKWFAGVVTHASHFLAISEATQRDFIALAEKSGHMVPDDRVSVVPLDADFRQHDGRVAEPVAIGRPYVLLVSTVEVRKNQMAVLGAWRELINRRGATAVPQLVLVGKHGGYGADQVLRRIEHDETLRERVTILKNVDDAVLRGLYEGALFTVFPSDYEGWGLPVTEALCYGKVPLIADNSSLPEAGGGFAPSFRTGSPASLLAGIEQLLDDGEYRSSLERRILAEFRPRGWKDIAGQVLQILQGWGVERVSGAWSGYHPPMVKPDAYYPLCGRIRDGAETGEAFRNGPGWHEIEEWGVWAEPTGARLAMCTDGDAPLRIAIRVQGLPDVDTQYRILANGVNAGHGQVLRTRFRWIFADVQPEDGRLTLEIVPDKAGYDVHTGRHLGAGIVGFFILEPTVAAEARFMEAAALGKLDDFDAFRLRRTALRET